MVSPGDRANGPGLFHVTTDAWWLVIGNGNKRLFSLAVNLASVRKASVEMKLYLVSYDLMTPGKDYPGLTKELTKLGRRINLSVWLIVVAKQTAAQVRDALLTHMDRNDRLLIVELPPGIDWALANSIPGGAAILKRERP